MRGACFDKSPALEALQGRTCLRLPAEEPAPPTPCPLRPWRWGHPARAPRCQPGPRSLPRRCGSGLRRRPLPESTVGQRGAVPHATGRRSQPRPPVRPASPARPGLLTPGSRRHHDTTEESPPRPPGPHPSRGHPVVALSVLTRRPRPRPFTVPAALRGAGRRRSRGTLCEAAMRRYVDGDYAARDSRDCARRPTSSPTRR